MAKEKISQMPAATSITGTESIPIVQGGGNKKLTPNLLLGGLFDIPNGNIKLTPVVAPLTVSAVVNATAGNLNGSYEYSTTFVTDIGETEAGGKSSVVTPSNQKVDLTILTSADSRVTKRRIYRQVAGTEDVLKKLVVEIANNTATTYTDNIADGALGAAIPRINTTAGNILSNTTRLIAASDGTTSFGFGAMANNNAYASSAFGAYSLAANTTGQRNVANGCYALNKNTTGSWNSAYGVHALNENLTGIELSAFGFGALMNNTTDKNSAFGAYALYANTSGGSNCAFGYYALKANLTGGNGCAFGYEALAANLSHGNTAIGSGAAKALTSDSNFNTVVGHRALESAVAYANGNTAIGYGALLTNTDGHNVALGYGAGYYETGNNKLFIDNDPRASEADARVKTLIYGVFAAAVANQVLTINAASFNLPYMPTYADNNAASTLATGRLYQTATGELRIKV